MVRVAGWEVPWTYTSPEDEAGTIRAVVGVADLSALGKLLVRGDVAQESITDALSAASVDPGYAAPIATKDKTGTATCDSYLARLTADEWLIITPPGSEDTTARTIEAKSAERNLFVTVVNQTSGLAGLAVVGPLSQRVLRKLCALP